MRSERIKMVSAHEILDSRGNPTISVTVELEGGIQGSASVPSGASTGKYEAYELRDGDAARYGGKGVLQAVAHVNGELNEVLRGRSVLEQTELDALLRDTDGTKEKKRLGANALLGASLAIARAAASLQQLPLWRWLGGERRARLPVPMMNVLNGGAHAGNGLDVQEFMLVPVGATSFSEGLRMGSEIYHTLGKMLHAEGLSTGVGDEGGFAPELSSTEDALDFLREAICRAGYTTGEVKISLDVAASEWQCEGGYCLPKSGKRYSGEVLLQYMESLSAQYPIFSIEDPLGEDDWKGFTELTARIGAHTVIVGDDLFVTNTERLAMGIEKKAANAILIKPNQIGTLSEVLDVIRRAQAAGYVHILSHRSGETDDAFIADLAIATNAPLIKAGAPCRGERVAKYNRLLAIEHAVGGKCNYGFADSHEILA